MPSYFALATLVEGPLHGYAIVRRAAELSDGQVRLSTGTLYALLERAIDEGLVVAGEPYLEGGRQRRDYTLTQRGRDELRAEADRLAHAARTGDPAVARVGHGGDVVSRERVARLALLAYPADVRAARGDEMRATLHDVSAGSGRAFAREAVDLVRLGLRARATATATAGAPRLIADGLCLAGVWLMVLDLATLIDAARSRARGPAAGRGAARAPRRCPRGRAGRRRPGRGGRSARVDGAAAARAVGPPPGIANRCPRRFRSPASASWSSPRGDGRRTCGGSAG